jgi:hypothetical protein
VKTYEALNIAYSESKDREIECLASGRGTGVVVATGSDTELGRINQLMAGVSALDTPLMRQIKKFGYAAGVSVLDRIILLYKRERPSEAELAAAFAAGPRRKNSCRAMAAKTAPANARRFGIDCPPGFSATASVSHSSCGHLARRRRRC